MHLNNILEYFLFFFGFTQKKVLKNITKELKIHKALWFIQNKFKLDLGMALKKNIFTYVHKTLEGPWDLVKLGGGKFNETPCRRPLFCYSVIWLLAGPGHLTI